MATGNIDIVVKLVDRASHGLAAIGQKVGGVASKLRSALMPAAALAGAGLGALAFGALKAVHSASDLNEAVNKAVVTFGKASGVVTEFADTSAKKFGISQRAANEYAATLGVILQGSGIAAKASADMSVDLVKLSADLASFNNIPIDVALEKIRAGLVGESEPLRTVGVLLSEAAVRQKALDMGLIKGKAVMTDAQKVQARYALILEQTSKQQGDFARTADGAANKERILAARMEDLRAKIGQRLLPVYVKLLGFIADKVFPWVEKKLPGALDRMERAWRDVSRVIVGFLREARPAAEKFFSLFLTGLQTILPVVKAVFEFIIHNKVALIAAIAAIGAAILLALGPGAAAVIAIVALIALVGLVKKNWSELEAKTRAVFNSLPGPVKVALEFIYSFTKARIEGVIQVFNSAYSIIKNVVSLVDNLLHGRWGAAWADLKKIASASLDLLLGMVKTQFGNLPAIILGAVTKAANAALGLGLKLGLSIVDGIKAGVIGLATFLWNTFKAAWNAGAKAANSVLNAASGLINKVDVFHIVPDLPKNPIPTLAKGGIVTKTGLAEVHEGEQFSGVGRRGGDIIINITGTWDLSNPNHIEQLTSALTGQIRRNLAMGA